MRRCARLARLLLAALFVLAPMASYAQSPVTLEITVPDFGFFPPSEGSPVNFTVRFDENVATTAPVEADWAISFPAASESVNPASAADFPSTNGTVSIPAGMKSVTLPITSVADNVNEATEEFIVTLGNPRGGGAGAAPRLHATRFSANSFIDQSDRARVEWNRIGPGTVTEKNSARFRFRLERIFPRGTGISGGPICVSFQTSVVSQRTPRNNAASGPDIGGITDCDGNPVSISNADSRAAGGFLFPAGRQTADLSIPVLFDGLDEVGNEELVVEITGVTRRAGTGLVFPPGRTANRTIRVFIANFNNAHNFAFTTPTAVIGEGAPAAIYTVTRTGPDISDGSTLTITWAYAAGDPAPAANDFTGGAVPAGGMLEFTGSDTSKTFSIAVADDNLNEPDERFTLILSVADLEAANAAGGATVPGAHTVAINDDDPIAVTVAADTAVSEGDDAVVNVNLGAIPTREIRIAYSTQITATAATDDVDATLSGAGADLGTFTDSITIAANTNPPIGSLTIPIVSDNLNEAAETFVVNTLAGSITGAYSTATVASGGTQTFTIAESDPMTYSIVRADDSGAVNEGLRVDFIVALSGASSGSAADIEVPYSVTGSGAYNVAADDQSGTAAIMAGSTAAMITLALPRSGTLGDSDPNQTLTVTLGETPTVGAGGGSVARAAGAGQSAQAEVNFVDVSHIFRLGSPATGIDETDADTDTIYTMTRAGPDIMSGNDLQIAWAVTAGTAVAADFSGGGLPRGTLTFSGGKDTDTFAIGIAGDNLNESSETFTILFNVHPSAAAAVVTEGGVLVPSTHTVAIADDDPIAVRVTATSAVSEGGDAVVNVNLGAIPGRDIRITWAGQVTATAATGDVDAVLSGAGADLGTFTDSITIAANTNPPIGSLAIPIVSDNLNEAAETFVVNTPANNITGAHGAAAVTSGGAQTFTIAESDPVTYGIARVGAGPVDEAGMVDFIVALSGASSGSVADIEVSYSVTGSGDYNVAADDRSGMVVIAAGTTAAALTLALPRSDSLGDDAPDQTLTVALGEPPSVGAGAGSVTRAADAADHRAQVAVNFVDADRAFSVSVDNAAADEGDTVVFTVALAGNAPGPAATVDWAIGGAGITTADYTVSGADTDGALSFNATGSQTIRVAINDDVLSEAAETLTFTLSNPGGGGAGITGISLPAAVAVTIGESDHPVTLQITVPPRGVFGFFEGVSNNNKFTVSFPERVVTTAPVEVDWAFSFPPVTTQGSASSADFSATNGTASIPAGQRTVDIPLNIVNENVNEADEYFIITLSNPRGGGAIAVPGLHAGLFSVTDFIGGNDGSRVQFIESQQSQRGTVARRTVSEGRYIEFEVEHIVRGGLRGISDGAICAGFDVSVFSQQTPANTDRSGPDIAGVTDCDGAPVSISDALSLASGGVLIPAGRQTARFRILARFDDLDEGGNEELVVELTGATPRVGATTVNLYSNQPRREARANIANVSADHIIAFTNPVTGIGEGASATYTVQRTGPAIADGSTLTITWAYAAGNPAPAAADFIGGAVPPGGTLEFTGSETDKTFSISVADDNLNEADERFTLALGIAPAHRAAATAAGGAIVPPDAHGVTITDNDPVTYSIARTDGAEPVNAGESVDFIVALSGASSGSAADIEVPYSVTGSGDYNVAAGDRSGAVVIMAGSTTAALTLALPRSGSTGAGDPEQTLAVTLGETPTVGAGGGSVTRAVAAADYRVQVPVNTRVGMPVRIRVFLEGAVIP
ncbi:MAG: hypothetical protein OXU50_00835 [Gammaproteobacteria bacterium]|nr:hypothetical protein [Gammaproteobacteria bacterium]